MAERLKASTSPYLRSAAESPIDWRPWGDEAFAAARRDDKPILLDIGAVWCHWCHVMDHGTYEDPEVVRRLSADFICIKVDRDERPDVDTRYQRAVGAITGQGGWPLTAFLTPEGHVFYGGTYFAAQSAHGRPGFRDVLDQIATIYRDDRARVQHSANHIAEALAEHARKGATPAKITPEILASARTALLKEHDPRYGGFGDAPKFPHTNAVLLALELDGSNDGDLRRLALRTLTKMAAGGIHDHVAGGFHRYSVDAHWTVPHFEKMAYDNAELLRTYTRAHAVTGDERLREVAEGIIDWTLTLLSDRERGGFGASQDADHAPGDDGDHFTWTMAEVRAALEPEAGDDGHTDAQTLYKIACARFGLDERGDMHHATGRNVLEHDQTHDEVAGALGLDGAAVRAAEAEILRRLRRARARRPQPFVDPTQYVEWNAMYASAFLEAGALLGRADATRHALKTLDRLRETAWDRDQGWAHRAGSDTAEAPGLLDDQAWMGLALVDAYRFTGRGDLLVLADDTAAVMMCRWVAPGGGFYDTPEGHGEGSAAPLALRHRPYLDQSGPGANPTAAKFLMRLGRATGRDDLVETARASLEWCAADAPRAGIFAATWAEAVDELLSDPPIVTVFGPTDDPETEDLLQAVRATPRTGLIIIHAAPGRDVQAPAAIAEALGNEDLIKEGPQMLVCRGDRCDAITRDIDDVRARLLTRPRRG